MLKALVSIHDVMPSTMQDVAELLGLCDEHGISKVTLLVVPGMDWNDEQLKQLSEWHGQGRELAGHGWLHKCSQISTWHHRLHSLVLSRNVAEHLSLTKSELVELISRCSEWFPQHDLPTPQLYVPPAWALGNLRSDDLRGLPFQMFESLCYLHFPQQRRQQLSPLVGFEADTLFRKLVLRAINFLSLRIASISDRPLRISIHPQDHRLKLASHFNQILSRPMQSMLYREIPV